MSAASADGSKEHTSDHFSGWLAPSVLGMQLIIVIGDVEEARQFTETRGQRMEEKKGFAPTHNSHGHTQ